MDQFYFEEGYLEASYFDYTAEARLSLEPYIEVGYLPQDFFEDRSSFATLYCDAEIVVGMLMEAQAYLSSLASIEATVYKLTDTSAAFNCEFTQTAIGTRGKDIDLFALSDAAIAVAVSRLRDNNIAASVVFDVATDFVVERSADADVDAVFSAIINGLRSRDTNIETQAAFSFGITPDLFKTFDSGLSAEASVSVTVEVTRTVDATVSSEASSSTEGNRIRFGVADVASEFTVSATARQIRDAHLTGTGVAAISCAAIKTASAQSTQSSAFSQTALAGTLETASSNLPVYASVFVSRNVGQKRPRNLVDNYANGLPSFSTTAKFGSYSLSGGNNISSNYKNNNFIVPTSSQSFYLELWHYPTSSDTNRNILWIYDFFQISQTNTGKYRFFGWTGNPNNSSGAVSGFDYTHTSNYTLNQWNHLAVVKTATSLAYYINGQRVYISTDNTNPLPYFGWGAIGNQNGGLYGTGIIRSSSIIFPVTGGGLTDEAFYIQDTTLGQNPLSSTIDVPTQARSNIEGTQFLYHFDNNVFDDVSLIQLGAAAIQSQASLVGSIGGTFNIGSSISSQFTVTAVIGTLEDINLVAFDDAELTIDVNVIGSGVSTVNAEASVSTTAQRSRDVPSSITSAFSQTTQPYRVRFNSIDTTSEFSQTASAVKTVVVAGSLSAQCSLTAVIGTLEDINLVAFSDAAVTTSAVKTTDINSDVSSEFTQQSAVNIIASFESAITSENSLTAINSRLRDVTVSLSTEASTLTLANEFEGATANLSSRFTTLQTYIEQEGDYYFDDGYFETFNTNVNYIASGSAAFTATSSLAVSIRTDVFVAMVTTSSASVVATVVKTTDVVSTDSSQFTLTAGVNKKTDITATPSSAFTVFCNGVTSAEINLVAFSNASISATLTGNKPLSAALASQATFYAYTQDSLNSVGEAHISSEFTVSATANYTVDNVIVTEAVASNLAVVVKTVAVEIPLDSNFTVSADVSRFRGTNITASASATVNATAIKTTNVDSEISSAFTHSAIARKTVNAQIITEAVASNLTAVVRLAGLFIECNVAATVASAAVVKRSASSAVTAQCQITATPTKLVIAQAAVNSVASVAGIIGVRKQFASAVSSALSFVVEIRDLRIDEIVYVIPGENWTYVIIGESRNHEIYGETRIRSITGETRERTIDGESRIHILD